MALTGKRRAVWNTGTVGYQDIPPVTEKPSSSAQGGRITRQNGRSLSYRGSYESTLSTHLSDVVCRFVKENGSHRSIPRIWFTRMKRSAQGGTELEKRRRVIFK
ncbi:hypothetical protein ARMGADRAFT_1014535 [Armillaria gallica]|uniref:Uncharacterized protein n=1 Tax=Armillaria gallica TaxID=47427 RepID=A0A2H3DFW8_ARMGA|nr:hypothetical protein ARMGADRAFT_1014535 [Armillaria gallica]